jgi:hypothetical protein
VPVGGGVFLARFFAVFRAGFFTVFFAGFLEGLLRAFFLVAIVILA